MRKSGERSGEPGIGLRAFSALGFRFVDSRAVWLALDESHEDSRRVACLESLVLAPVSLRELNLYHRQLFSWLLIRAGAYLCASQPDLTRKTLRLDFGSESD